MISLENTLHTQVNLYQKKLVLQQATLHLASKGLGAAVNQRFFSQNSMLYKLNAIAKQQTHRKMVFFKLVLLIAPVCFVHARISRQLAGVASDAVLDMEFYHDIDDTTLSVGTSHACALVAIDDSDVGGEVVCWGEVFDGQADPPDVSDYQDCTAERFAIVSALCAGCICSTQCCINTHVWHYNRADHQVLGPGAT